MHSGVAVDLFASLLSESPLPGRVFLSCSTRDPVTVTDAGAEKCRWVRHSFAAFREFPVVLMVVTGTPSFVVKLNSCT